MIRVETNEIGKKYHFVYHVNESKLRTMRATIHPIFSDIFDNRWLIGFYLNTKTNQNFVGIALDTCKWPIYTKELHIKTKFKCLETGDEFCPTLPAIYKMDHIDATGSTNWGKDGWFLSSKLNDAKTVTIIVDVEIVDH